MSEVRARKSQPFDRDLLLLLAVVLGVLALFVRKAFTIDDPLFLWLAQHLQSQPLDFYGFDVNWGGTVRPMHEVTMNPPLVGYFIAGAASIFGWSEMALHIAFLLPAAGAVVGTYWLARRLSDQPMEAGLAALLSPVFLVSSSNLMCDTSMLALWCAAIACWVHGFDTGSQRWRMAAGGFAGLAFLAKYFAIALLPLLLAYGVLRERRAGSWLLPLLIPLAVVVAYDLTTYSLYGHAMFLGAALYPGTVIHTPAIPAQVLIGLSFAGGCTIAALCYAPFLWSWRTLVIAWGLFMVIMLAPGAVRWVLSLKVTLNEQWSFFHEVQLFVLVFGGAGVIGLAVADFKQHRTPESALLALWVLGTWVFATFLNWSNNGRSNLVLAPAVGILIVRRLASLRVAGWQPGRIARGVALATAAAVAVGVVWSDVRWADNVREAANALAREHAHSGRTTYANADWGMQYYLESGGVRTLDLDRDTLVRGDLLILSNNNTNPRRIAAEDARLIDTRSHPESIWGMTHSLSVGAGFYSSIIGPLPYAFGPSLPDRYDVWRVKRPFQLDPADLGEGIAGLECGGIRCQHPSEHNLLD
jgi:4-amino-4-deoxy-L-arabinose transferase-like glycosyltransferase